MINETVILLTPFKDYSKHRLSKYIKYYLGSNDPTYLYFYEALKKIFSKVIIYDYPKQTIKIGPKAINKEIIDIVRKEHPKYVVWLPAFHDFLESTFDTIREEGTIVVGIFFDDEYRFDDYSKWWISHLDYCTTNDIEAIPKYRELGAKVIHIIPPAGVPFNRDWLNIKERYDVSFIGAKRPDRERYINEIKKRNIPIHLFGERWGRYVSREEMTNIFRSSKINLNFSRTRGNRMGWKGRVLEVCLAGGFLLTEYFPEIEKYFEIDKEIVCFHNAEEIIDKINYYLTHKKERLAIAQAGWKRAINEYTPFHIMSRVFREIEEDLAAKDKKNNHRPKEIKMTKQMRENFSEDYFRWAVALSMEDYKDIWKDALELSILYNPLNILARCYYIIGFSPSFVRRILRPLCKLYIKLYRTLHFKLLFVPYLRKYV